MLETVAAANEFPREAAAEEVLTWLNDILSINGKFNSINLLQGDEQQLARARAAEHQHD